MDHSDHHTDTPHYEDTHGADGGHHDHAFTRGTRVPHGKRR